MTAVPQRIWTRYVAIGDSFTEGMCDADPAREDTFVGWADRLAGLLAAEARKAGEELRYANLAVRGRLLDDVVGPQLDAALAMEPDLVSMVGGGNDILRPKVDVDDVARRIEEAVVAIRATGADVLLATPVDPSEAPLVRLTRGRAAAHAANIFSIATEHGCHVIDQWRWAALRDWRMWAPDRIHLTTEGHRRVALHAFHALGFDTERDDWFPPLPPAEQVGTVEATKANAAWAREYVGPWVQRRLTGRSSGDNITAKRPRLERVTAHTD
ncbi:SGNH/GDSL hydrolase family protein [Actinomycetota bacterium]